MTNPLVNVLAWHDVADMVFCPFPKRNNNTILQQKFNPSFIICSIHLIGSGIGGKEGQWQSLLGGSFY